MDSWDPADFKTVFEKPKRWTFIGDIDKNATGYFFLGHPVLLPVHMCHYQFSENLEQSPQLQEAESGQFYKLLLAFFPVGF